MRTILKSLIIHERNIAANLHESACQVSTEALMFRLSDIMGKQAAHKLLYDLSMQAYSSNRPLQELLEEHPEISGKLDPALLAELLNPANHIGVARQLTARSITAAEEWLATNRPVDLSANVCPLAGNDGECSISMDGPPEDNI
jgi:adenylosuccinate lyase